MARSKKLADLKIEDVLAEQLKREMFVTSGSRFRYIDDWDTVMHSVYELPIEYNGYTKRVGEMKMLKEMVDILAKGDFQDVKRSESRRKQLKEFTSTQHMYYNLIFTKEGQKIGYGALLYFPELKPEEAERSGGVVLMAKLVVKGKEREMSLEKARFEDFLLEVKPYIEILGDLYRKSRKP